MCTGWSVQSQSIQLHDPLHLSEEHLDLLPVSARSLVERRGGDSTGDIPRRVVNTAGDLADGRAGATARLQRAMAIISRTCTNPLTVYEVMRARSHGRIRMTAIVSKAFQFFSCRDLATTHLAWKILSCVVKIALLVRFLCALLRPRRAANHQGTLVRPQGAQKLDSRERNLWKPLGHPVVDCGSRRLNRAVASGTYRAANSRIMCVLWLRTAGCLAPKPFRRI